MTNPGRKKRKKNTVLRTVFRLFFFLLLLSMLAAYISNQVAISSGLRAWMPSTMQTPPCRSTASVSSERFSCVKS